MISSLRLDFRCAIRGLVRAPAFSFLAAATLALGIGANAAIFSVADAVLIRPLPYAQASRLAAITMTRSKARDRIPLSVADFLDWRAQNRAFASLAGYS